ncbi:MAG: MBL fold metallo-hydrolase [Pseudomonadota bacterium]|nr:MBL fold metallo-hydrolase [Pseudomonadota bacterium]
MRFTLVGTGTTLPDATRGPAGFLVESDGARILVDGGTGTIGRLAALGVDARELDGGVYSHRHVDHCGDLVPLLFTMKVGIDKPRRRDYPIWAGSGFEDFFAALEGVYGSWIQPEGWKVRIAELVLDAADGADLPGGVRLDTLPAVHTAGALHLSFTSPSGYRVVFSGDTGPSEALAVLARGADVLVTECAVETTDRWNSHLCATDVAAIVDAARPKRVVLTHLYPMVDPTEALQVVRATGVPVERGHDGQVLEG